MRKNLPRTVHIATGIVSLQIASDESPYFDLGIVTALTSVVERLSADQTIHVVLVEGGSCYFSAGASRRTLLSADAEKLIAGYASELPGILLSLPVPTIAVMAGHAVGGGFVLGLWCDIVLLAEESLYGANFMNLGFTPGMGASVVLEETVGGPLARELLFTGRLMKGREIRNAGSILSHAVVKRASVRARAIAIAEELAEVPREALVQLKQTLSARRQVNLEWAVKSEQAMHAHLFAQTSTQQRIAERYPLARTEHVQGE
jgi:enoyl-CoA hydratase/carnithine racemase